MPHTTRWRHRNRDNKSRWVIRESCRFLRCAARVIEHTESSDCVRVLRNDVSSDGCVNGDGSGGARTESEVETATGEMGQPTPKKQESDEGDNTSDCEQKIEPSEQSTNDAEPQPQPLIITTTLFTEKDATIPTNPSFPKQSIIYVKPLIVLDLNGILCYRLRDRDRDTELPIEPAPPNETFSTPTLKTTHRKSTARIANTEIIPRSDLPSFLHLLHQHFSLAVWTSATPKTAKYLVRLLFPEHIRSRLIFVWGRNYCNLVEREELDSCLDGDVEGGGRKQKRRRKNGAVSNDEGLSSENVTTEKTQNDAKVQNQTNATNENLSADNHYQDLIAIKSLSKVWSAYPLWDNTNTLLLDDSPDKCPKRFRGNAIHPPPLCGTETSHCDDSSGGNETEGKETVTDDDEANQSMQRQFFQLLAQNWSCPIDLSLMGSGITSQKCLDEFLTEHAAAHNMRWK